MSTHKAFDAVQMKWDIQQRLEAEFAGLTPEERRAAQWRKITSNPRMAEFLRRVRVLNDPTGAER